MSSQIDPSPGASKAQAKADKAYRKAMRPWFKKKRFIIPLILIALVVIGALAGGDEDATSPAGTSGSSEQPADSQPADQPESMVGIGQPVSDGKFEFTVTGVENPGKTIGEVFPQEAQGTWVIVRVDVTNTGNEAGMLDASSQKAFDGQGREFTAESVPSLEDWDKVFLNAINPGNGIKGAPIVFDVPDGTTLDRIELHDSLFSGGAEVSLEE